MCGFLALFAEPGTDAAPAEQHVLRGLESLRHRGPDSSRCVTLTHEGNEVVLGAVRLRVVDLNPEGDMPMQSGDGRLQLVYNGELYNAAELRRQLERAGHRFVSKTDTECVLHLYEEYGGDLDHVLADLRGMFAFVLWDEGRCRVVAARDRLGIKPLVYARTARGLLLGSETRALAVSGLLDDHELDDRAARGFLAWGTVPGELTPLRAVTRLLPGHLLEWTGGAVRVREYWSPTPRPLEDLRDATAARIALASALDDAVTRHLIADRPLGLFLSSGADSSVLASIAGRHARLDALTLSFPGEPGDEGEAAAALAARYGHAHQRLVLDDADAGRSLDAFLADIDAPTIDGYNTWLVSREASRRGLVVALTGAGGDELFGGYATFGQVPRTQQLARLLTVVPAPARRAALSYTSRNSPGGRLTRLLGVPGTDAASAYRAVRGLFAPGELGGAVGDAWPGLAARARLGEHPGDKVTQLELAHFIGEQLLPDADSVSMAHSLEIRVPLLDDVVVRTALSVPAETRLAPGKSLLLAAAGMSTPPAAKLPFAVPMERWLRGPMRERLRQGLLDEQLPFASLVPATSRRALFQAFDEGRCHWSRAWSVAVLRLWPVLNGLPG